MTIQVIIPPEPLTSWMVWGHAGPGTARERVALSRPSPTPPEACTLQPHGIRAVVLAAAMVTASADAPASEAMIDKGTDITSGTIPTISPVNELASERDLLDRRVLAVKIDNAEPARPPVTVE